MLNDGDKAECKEIAREINREVLAAHIASCPYGKTIFGTKMLLVGLCIGNGLLGGGAVFGLMRIFLGS